MADEKSIVKMNKMIHKKTGASFLVFYVIYVSLVSTAGACNERILLSIVPCSCLLEKAGLRMHAVRSTTYFLYRSLLKIGRELSVSNLIS